MKPFIELFLLGVTTPIRLACDIASGIAEGISWHRAIPVANIRHCEIASDFLPTLSCAYRIGRPVRVIAKSVAGDVHLVIRPDDWTNNVYLRFKTKELLRIATCNNLFRRQDTLMHNYLVCMTWDHVIFAREIVANPKHNNNIRVTPKEREAFFNN
jgi:hypothetical protein